MAAGAGDAGVAQIDASFISRSILGAGALNTLKGVAWGNVVALSQALGKTNGRHADVHSAAVALPMGALEIVYAGWNAALSSLLSAKHT
jgi:hypothetical protein